MNDQISEGIWNDTMAMEQELQEVESLKTFETETASHSELPIAYNQEKEEQFTIVLLLGANVQTRIYVTLYTRTCRTNA